MARKSKIRLSKTRVRHHVRRLAEYAADDIDRFRVYVAEAREARQRSVDRRAAKLPLEAQEFLAEELAELDLISRLADEFSIVALYRVVELTTGRILAHEFGRPAEKTASNIVNLSDLLKRQKGMDLATLPHYRAIDELRLLNNAVKHTGRVTKELAVSYPRWNEGDELTRLDQAYDAPKSLLTSSASLSG